MLKKIIYISLALILVFLPFLGSVHLLDWDEANFAELAREMIVSGNYMQPQINFMPFYEKPPLFIWLQVLSMKLFGINEFAARFPNAMTGIVVLISLFYIGRKHFGERMAWLWAICFGLSIAPHFYFKTALIDPLFNYFIFLSIYFFGYLFLDSSKKIHFKYTILSALYTALAVMTKGPVAIILIIGSIGFGWILLKFKSIKNIAWTIPWLLIAFGLSSLWFIYETYLHGSKYVEEFITYQIRLFQTEDAKHGGTILFHPIALLLGCFPASIFMWSTVKKKINFDTEFQEILFKLMLSCGIVILVVFSLVQTKIIHYSSMDYYPMTFFAAYGLNYLFDSKSKLAKWQIVFLSVIGFIWGLALTITPYLGQNLKKIKPYIHDTNFLEQLKTPIEWNLWACGFGLVFLVLYFKGILFLTKNELKKGLICIFLACFICLETVFLYYLPRIENLVQGSMVEFIQSKKDENCYFSTFYMKSYNVFFYSNLKSHSFDTAKQNHLFWIYSDLDRKTYYTVLTKDTAKVNVYKIPGLKFIESKSGYCFYERPATK